MSESQKANSSCYDKYALQWAATKINSFSHEKPFRKFVRYFRKAEKIIDIGCAYGIHVPGQLKDQILPQKKTGGFFSIITDREFRSKLKSGDWQIIHTGKFMSFTKQLFWAVVYC